MKDATGVIEGNGKATYQNIHEIKSTMREGRIHLKTQSDTDEITVESKDTHEKLGFCAFAKNGTLYLTSNKKIKRIKNIGKGTITVTLPKDMELEKAELDLKAGELRAEQIFAKDLEVNAGAGEKIVYAIPTSFGTPTFNVGGFDGGFTKAQTLEFTNASGYKQSYDVWMSVNAGLGSTAVTVK